MVEEIKNKESTGSHTGRHKSIPFPTSSLHPFLPSSLPGYLKIMRSTSARAVLLLPALAVTVTIISSRSLVMGSPLSLPASWRKPFQSCRERREGERAAEGREGGGRREEGRLGAKK